MSILHPVWYFILPQALYRVKVIFLDDLRIRCKWPYIFRRIKVIVTRRLYNSALFTTTTFITKTGQEMDEIVAKESLESFNILLQIMVVFFSASLS